MGIALTFSENVVLALKLPDVPVTVMVAVPVAVEPLAVNVRRVEVVAGFVLNDDVTPFGRPETEKLTLPLKPFWGVMLIVVLPLPPCAMLTLVGDAESV
jgi:hypothetical protein